MVTTLSVLDAVIVDDEPVHQRDSLALLQAAFPDTNITPHFATNAPAGREHLLRLDAAGDRPLIGLIDVHMDPDGKHPHFNGNCLVPDFASRSHCMAVISGTQSNDRLVELAENTHGLVYIAKDLTHPGATETERRWGIERLHLAMETPPPLQLASEQEFLDSLVSQPMNLKPWYKLIATLKARASAVFRLHQDEVWNIPEVSKLLHPHGLYDGNPKDNVHTYKNQLTHLIQTAASDSSALQLSPGLMTQLSGLLAFVVTGYSDVRREKEEVDITATSRRIASIHQRTEPGCIELSNVDEEHKIRCNPIHLNKLLTIIIENAVLHRDRNHPARLRCYPHQVQVVNQCPDERAPGFSISDNHLQGSITFGEICSSSGTGLLAALDLVEQLNGVKLSMYHGDGEVVTTLKFDSDSAVLKVEPPKVVVTGAKVEVQHDHVLFVDGSFADAEEYRPTVEAACSALGLHVIDGVGLGGYEMSTMGQYEDTIMEFMAQNDELLQRTCICIVHTAHSGIGVIQNPIAERYPHIAMLPVSSSPDTVSRQVYSELLAGFYTPPTSNILRTEQIQSLHSSDDPAPLDMTLHRQFDRDMPSNVWATMLAIAQRYSEQLSTPQ